MEDKSDVHQTARKGFTDGASSYASSRRAFPVEGLAAIVDIVGQFNAPVLLDLGAGTGRFTQAIAPYTTNLIAVEPLAKMRHQFAQLLPEIQLLAGSAESIPLQAETSDIVTCVDAFHWFTNSKALAEIERVLRPQGKLLLIWTTYDRNSPLIATLLELIEPYKQDTPNFSSGQWRHCIDGYAAFQMESTEQVAYRRPYSRQQITQRFMSVSYISRLPSANQKQLIADIARALAQEPEDAVELPERMDLFVYEKR